MLVGVLALQGAFREHERVLQQLGCKTRQVRTREDLEGLKAIVIPGGESTTMGRLLVEEGLLEPLRQKIAGGLPAFGSCAGLVVLSQRIADSKQPRLGIVAAEAVRNAFGRQVDSFEVDLNLAPLGEKPFRGVFIRAPYLRDLGAAVTPLGTLDGRVVCARQGQVLVSAFHPELTGDPRLHQYFLAMTDEMA